MFGPVAKRQDGTVVFASPVGKGHVPMIALSDLGFFARYIFDHRTEKYERGGEIRKYAKSISQAQKGRRRSDRSSGEGVPVVVQFADLDTRYTIKRELGAGAFAPVYLVENSDPQINRRAVATRGTQRTGEHPHRRTQRQRRHRTRRAKQ